MMFGVVERGQLAQCLRQDREHARVTLALDRPARILLQTIFDLAHLRVGSAPHALDQACAMSGGFVIGCGRDFWDEGFAAPRRLAFLSSNHGCPPMAEQL